MKKRNYFLALLAAAVLLCSMSVCSFAAVKTMPDGGQFDAEFYAATYPDVKNALGTNEADLYNHYKNFGVKEGRLPFAQDTKNAPVKNEMVKLPFQAPLITSEFDAFLLNNINASEMKNLEKGQKYLGLVVYENDYTNVQFDVEKNEKFVMINWSGKPLTLYLNGKQHKTFADGESESFSVNGPTLRFTINYKKGSGKAYCDVMKW